MGAVWIGIAVAAVVSALAVVALRLTSMTGGSDDVDVGPVSEGWLEDQRGRDGS